MKNMKRLLPRIIITILLVFGAPIGAIVLNAMEDYAAYSAIQQYVYGEVPYSRDVVDIRRFTRSEDTADALWGLRHEVKDESENHAWGCARVWNGVLAKKVEGKWSVTHTLDRCDRGWKTVDPELRGRGVDW